MGKMAFHNGSDLLALSAELVDFFFSELFELAGVSLAILSRGFKAPFGDLAVAMKKPDLARWFK